MPRSRTPLSPSTLAQFTAGLCPQIERASTLLVFVYVLRARNVVSERSCTHGRAPSPTSVSRQGPPESPVPDPTIAVYSATALQTLLFAVSLFPAISHPFRLNEAATSREHRAAACFFCFVRCGWIFCAFAFLTERPKRTVAVTKLGRANCLRYSPTPVKLVVANELGCIVNLQRFEQLSGDMVWQRGICSSLEKDVLSSGASVHRGRCGTPFTQDESKTGI